MRIAFDDGTLLLKDAPDFIPYAEWDDRVDEYRSRSQHYREIKECASRTDGQATLHESAATVESVEDVARAYSEFALTSSVAIELRDYQQKALSA